MAIVQVRGNRVVAEASVVSRKVIDIAHENGFTVPGVIHRSWTDAIKSPNGLHRKIRRHAYLPLLLSDLIELLACKFCKRFISYSAPSPPASFMSNFAHPIQ